MAMTYPVLLLHFRVFFSYSWGRGTSEHCPILQCPIRLSQIEVSNIKCQHHPLYLIGCEHAPRNGGNLSIVTSLFNPAESLVLKCLPTPSSRLSDPKTSSSPKLMVHRPSRFFGCAPRTRGLDIMMLNPNSSLSTIPSIDTTPYSRHVLSLHI